MNRRFAIGDIHGCSNTLDTLLKKTLKISKEDQIYFVGDFIDRGPRNKEVIELIIDLKKDGYQIFPTLGNHEYFVLRDI